MTDTVISALITGGLTLAGVFVTSFAQLHRVEQSLSRAQAVTDTKLTELTREVHEHNDFARRIPVLEEKLSAASRRIEELERKVSYDGK